jgi:hypothetical protein
VKRRRFNDLCEMKGVLAKQGLSQLSCTPSNRSLMLKHFPAWRILANMPSVTAN